MRVICWFSCGAASACAAKLALEKYGSSRLIVVYCDTMATEHPDNARFYQDVTTWLGIPIIKLRSKKYATIDDVFEKERYMSGINGARCTTEMKKLPRLDFQRPDDIHIFGLCADEKKRIKQFEDNNLELTIDWILRDQKVDKSDCYKTLALANVKLPEMYLLGFANNNCLGCVKATSAVYWDQIRYFFPDVFAKRAQQSRELGVRLVRYHGERIFIDELPAVITDLRKEKDIECSLVCVTEAG